MATSVFPHREKIGLYDPLYEHDACGMTAELDALRRRQGWGYDDLGRLIEAKARAATRGCMATMPWATASARPTRWGA